MHTCNSSMSFDECEENVINKAQNDVQFLVSVYACLVYTWGKAYTGLCIREIR